MSDWNNQPAGYGGVAQTRDMSIDEGLRSYMLGVYNYMALALGVTGVTALGTAVMAMNSPEFAQAVYGGPLKWVIMLAPLGMVFFLGMRIHAMSVGTAQATFWVFATLMGMSISSIFLVFTGESIVQMFFVTAAAFGALSLYGYTTKKDLSGWGSFLIMGLFGIIIASIVNIFIGSSALGFAVSVIGVLVFAGLTAYDTQRIKEMYYEGDGHEMAAKKSIMGALSLYLNFINMFMMLLSLFGNRE